MLYIFPIKFSPRDEHLNRCDLTFARWWEVIFFIYIPYKKREKKKKTQLRERRGETNNSSLEMDPVHALTWIPRSQRVVRQVRCPSGAHDPLPCVHRAHAGTGQEGERGRDHKAGVRVRVRGRDAVSPWPRRNERRRVHAPLKKQRQYPRPDDEHSCTANWQRPHSSVPSRSPIFSPRFDSSDPSVRSKSKRKGEREERSMDQVLNKVGSYWFSKRASKEIDSIGDDISVSARPPPASLFLLLPCAPLSKSVLHLHCLASSKNRGSGSDLLVVGGSSFLAKGLAARRLGM